VAEQLVALQAALSVAVVIRVAICVPIGVFMRRPAVNFSPP